uniref:Uncharacterized protein n=1 Tax=Oryza punctata TaxID=4537 RepID=A0A0E0K4F4_ORYPU
MLFMQYVTTSRCGRVSLLLRVPTSSGASDTTGTRDSGTTSIGAMHPTTMGSRSADRQRWGSGAMDPVLVCLGCDGLRGHVFRKQWIKDGRPRSTPLALSPNLTFWAAHRLHGTRPVEIDFLGLGLQGAGMLDLLGIAAAAGISSDDDVACANATAPASTADDDGEESVGDQAEGDVDDGLCCCPYYLDEPPRCALRSHLGRHYRAVIKARVHGGLAPLARIAILHAGA